MELSKIALASLMALTLAACDGDDGKDGTNGTNGTNGAPGTNGVSNLVTRDNVITTNANIAYATYSDSLIAARQMHEVLEDFVANPTADNMQDAKEAWLAAREPYGQTEVYRFREGPIDALKADGTLGEEGDGPEGRINAWPLAEAIIDYIAPEVDGVDTADTGVIAGGLIFNTTAAATIDKATIANFFENGEDEANVTTGYHVIEFLLWGQDLNEDLAGSGERDMSGGQRPVSDYSTNAVQAGGICTAGRDNAAVAVAGDVFGSCKRRGQYLLAASELLIDDLAAVVKSWEPGVDGNHYANFVAGGDVSLSKILGGMGRLSFGELAGERMKIALKDNSQEDEHSCFSDNTHRDIFLNAKGVQNSFEGSYTRINGEVVKGASIRDLLVVEDEPQLANKLRAELEDTMVKASVIDTKAKTGTPFDNLIQEGINQPNVSAVINSLVTQTNTIKDAIGALNVTDVDLCQDTEEDIGECAP